MIKFYMIITLLLVLYCWMWRIEKDLIEEKEQQELRQKERELVFTNLKW